MNPHQANKVDITKMSPEEAKLFRLYGKLPNKKDLLQNKLKERKYFDSGDYALSKAGKASDIGVTSIGREHPVPEKIPHIAPPTPNGQQHGQQHGQHGQHSQHGQHGQAQNGQDKTLSGSPVKEHTFLHRETSLNRETSAEELEREANKEEPAKEEAVKA
ncbi:Endosulfine-domain-containing protein [Massarina eburnea CBS 473.64]|uniref:mRNA stability protein n=1 Tax=Massarina eburnea CBS 473.64 TaxID=1395130 RepID=A0A6A6RKG2_9PLEO|nr:Endosulfine-domain-containing protein [Massarina eburnea CBS 473.64]